MSGSGGKRMGVLGRLRNMRDTRRQRRAEKAHAKGEAKRNWERSGEVGRHGPHESRGAGG